MISSLKASDYRSIARENLSGHWGVAVGTTLVASLLGADVLGTTSSSGSGFSSGFNANFNMDDTDSQAISSMLKSSNIDFSKIEELVHIFAPIIMIILIIGLTFAFVQFILGGPVSLGLCAFNRKLYKGENPEFKDLISQFDIFGKAFLARLVIIIFVSLWSLLFIIPGIIASFAYSMTFFILEEHPDMEIMDAIHASKEMMRGNKWKLFCLSLSFIGWAILCTFTLGIGSLFLNPYINQSFYAFYKEISAPATQENIPNNIEIPVEL